MPDVRASWTRDTDANVGSYTVFFALNGAAPVSMNVPRTPAGDSSGYTALYSGLSPAPPALNPGDSIVVSAESVDTFGQASPILSAAGSPVVVPTPTPPPPTGPVGLAAVYVP